MKGVKQKRPMTTSNVTRRQNIFKDKANETLNKTKTRLILDKSQSPKNVTQIIQNQGMLSLSNQSAMKSQNSKQKGQSKKQEFQEQNSNKLYRLPSLSKCLEHEILPKNSIMLRQLCELASTNRNFLKSHFNEFIKKNSAVSPHLQKTVNTKDHIQFNNDLQSLISDDLKQNQKISPGRIQSAGAQRSQCNSNKGGQYRYQTSQVTRRQNIFKDKANETLNKTKTRLILDKSQSPKNVTQIIQNQGMLSLSNQSAMKSQNSKQKGQSKKQEFQEQNSNKLYRLPSLSKCLEHEILPKNSIMLRQLCELASTNRNFLKSHFNEFIKKNSAVSPHLQKTVNTKDHIQFNNDLQSLISDDLKQNQKISPGRIQSAGAQRSQCNSNKGGQYRYQTSQVNKVDLKIDTQHNMLKPKNNPNLLQSLFKKDSQEPRQINQVKIHLPFEKAYITTNSKISQNYVNNLSFISSPKILQLNNLNNSNTHTQENDLNSNRDLLDITQFTPLTPPLAKEDNQTQFLEIDVFEKKAEQNQGRNNFMINYQFDTQTTDSQIVNIQSNREIQKDQGIPNQKQSTQKFLRKKIFSAQPQNRKKFARNQNSNDNLRNKKYLQEKRAGENSTNNLLKSEQSKTEVFSSFRDRESDVIESQMEPIGLGSENNLIKSQNQTLIHKINEDEVYIENMSPIKVKNYPFHKLQNTFLDQKSSLNLNDNQTHRTTVAFSPSNHTNYTRQAQILEQSKSGLGNHIPLKSFNVQRRTLKSAGRQRINKNALQTTRDDYTQEEERTTSLTARRANLNHKNTSQNNPSVRFRYNYRDHSSRGNAQVQADITNNSFQKRELSDNYPNLDNEDLINIQDAEDSNNVMLSEQYYRSQIEQQMKDSLLNSFYRNNVRYEMKQNSDGGKHLLNGIDLMGTNSINIQENSKNAVAMQTSYTQLNRGDSYESQGIIREADTIQEKATMEIPTIHIYNENINSNNNLHSNSLIHISLQSFLKPQNDQSQNVILTSHSNQLENLSSNNHLTNDNNQQRQLLQTQNLVNNHYQIKSVYQLEKEAASQGLIQKYSMYEQPNNSNKNLGMQGLSEYRRKLIERHIQDNVQEEEEENDGHYQSNTITQDEIQLQQQLLKEIAPHHYSLVKKKLKLTNDLISPKGISLNRTQPIVITPKSQSNLLSNKTQQILAQHKDYLIKQSQTFSQKQLKDLQNLYDEQQLLQLCFSTSPSSVKYDPIYVSQKINELIKREKIQKAQNQQKDMNVQTSQKHTPLGTNSYRIELDRDENVRLSNFQVQINNSGQLQNPRRKNIKIGKARDLDITQQTDDMINNSAFVSTLQRKTLNSSIHMNQTKTSLPSKYNKSQKGNLNQTQIYAMSNLDLLEKQRKQQRKFMIQTSVLSSNNKSPHSRVSSLHKMQQPHNTNTQMTGNGQYQNNANNYLQIQQNNEVKPLHKDILVKTPIKDQYQSKQKQIVLQNKQSNHLVQSQQFEGNNSKQLQQLHSKSQLKSNSSQQVLEKSFHNIHSRKQSVTEMLFTNTNLQNVVGLNSGEADEDERSNKIQFINFSKNLGHLHRISHENLCENIEQLNLQGHRSQMNKTPKQLATPLALEIINKTKQDSILMGTQQNKEILKYINQIDSTAQQHNAIDGKIKQINENNTLSTSREYQTTDRINLMPINTKIENQYREMKLLRINTRKQQSKYAKKKSYSSELSPSNFYHNNQQINSNNNQSQRDHVTEDLNGSIIKLNARFVQPNSSNQFDK
eukprot:403336077